MTGVLSTVVIWTAVAAGLVALLLTVLNRPIRADEKLGTWVVTGLLVVELLLIVHAVAGIVVLSTGDRDVSGLTVVAYLIGVALVLPVATLWSLAEKSRWGAAVLAIGCFAVAVMVVRVNQVWAAAGV